jgi:hypothetical protein
MFLIGETNANDQQMFATGLQVWESQIAADGTLFHQYV